MKPSPFEYRRVDEVAEAIDLLSDETRFTKVLAGGQTLGPMMKEKGYDADYVVNVSATSAITGLLIPPSHNMIIYAAAAGVSLAFVRRLRTLAVAGVGFILITILAPADPVTGIDR